MIWATTQQYANAAHEMATLNGGRPLDDAAFERAKRQVIDTIVGGVVRGLTPVRRASQNPRRRRRAADRYLLPQVLSSRRAVLSPLKPMFSMIEAPTLM